MKRLFCILIILYAAIFFHSSALANTYPTDVRYMYLTGCFGEQRLTPTIHDHKGVDIVGATAGEIKGATVYAFRKGVIIFAGDKNDGYGNQVLIQHEDGTQARYAHLATISNDFEQKYKDWSKVRDPQLYKQLEVAEAQEIGTVGNTGCGDGYHLHFEIIKSDGKTLDDPQKYLPLLEFREITAPGCGYPKVTEMGVIAAKVTSTKDNKVIIQGQTKGFAIYGQVEGDRATKLYLNEYAKMSIDGTVVPGKVTDSKAEEEKGKGLVCKAKYQYGNSNDYTFGDHTATLNILDYNNKTESTKTLNFAIIPSVQINALTVDAAKMIASGQMTYIGVKDATVKSNLSAQEQGASLTQEVLTGKVVLKTASTEQVLTPTITITADGKAEASAQATGLEDGMHTALVEVLDDNGQVTDSKQKVFMVDTTPPVILKDKLEDIVTKTGLVFLPMGQVEPGTYFYTIPFKEEDSGVARIEVLEGGNVRTIDDGLIHRGGAPQDFSLVVNEEPFGNRVLTVRIYDQAGNVGEKTFSFKSSQAPISREIGEGPLTGSKKIRQYCYATRYGGTYDPEPSSFYITGGRVGHGGVAMNTPLYIKTNKHTTVQSASSYLAVAPDAVDARTGWRTWKVTQTKPVPGSIDPGFVQLAGPLYIDFTVMERDMSIIGEEPGPSVSTKFVVGYEIAGLRAGLGYNSEANALDARWENRQAQDLMFILNLDGSEVLPTEITADAFRYTPISEGSHHAVLSIYDRILNGWGKLERDFSVNLGAPRIADFAYITEDGVFRAQITDKSTALRDLDLEFYLNGVKSLFEFDKTTGKLTGLLYDRPDQGTVTAQLFVIDKAGNRVSSLAKAQFYTSAEGVATGVSVSIAPADVQIGGPVSFTEGNCTTTYQREDNCWVRVAEECIVQVMGVDKLDSLVAKDMLKTLVREGTIYDADNHPIALKEYTLPNGTRTSILTKRVDTCPPTITDLRYDAASHTMRARISDPSTPLSALRIQYGGSAILGNEWYDLRNPHFDFSTATGEFVGDLQGEDTEIYDIRLSVDDRYNKTYGNLGIRDPKKPPEVNLYFDELSGSANGTFLNALGLEQLLVGEYSDASGIDEGRTELEIDGVIKRNYITYPLGQISTRLLYRADLAEGRHRARLRVADTLGLENETYLVFDVTFKPHIQRFAYQGMVEGVPVFVAFIKDQGFDVTLEGITLLLDGKEIPRDQCFFNPQTGFFSVSGPLEIAAGAHQAVLTAVDSQGNRAEEALSFGGPVAEEVLAEAVGGVRITGYSAWDVQGNGDGRINPGEQVRLFVELLSDLDIAQARGSLRISHPSITIEQEQADYGDIPTGRRTESVDGFELVIKDDFFRNINSQVEDVACNLTLTDQADKKWVLPFRITVYRPLEIFRDAQGPAVAPSLSLEIIQPQDGVEYWANPPANVEGRFTVTGSTLDFIMAEFTCDRWPWRDPIDIPLSVNTAAGTFSGPLRSLVPYWPRGHYTLTVGAENSAGDWTEVTIRFSIDKLE